MELLLFLSAILSALTGVISGGRVAETQVHQSCGVCATEQVVIASQTRSVSAVRSYLSLAGSWQLPIVTMPAGFRYAAALFTSIPRYQDKLRN